MSTTMAKTKSERILNKIEKCILFIPEVFSAPKSVEFDNLQRSFLIHLIN